MKGLQGMVRSLIGTVADQHDNTQKLQEQLEQGKTSFFIYLIKSFTSFSGFPSHDTFLIIIWLKITLQ